MLRTSFIPLREKFRQLKQSVSDWVVVLDTKQFELDKKVQELELRIKQMEENKGWQ